MAARDTQAGRRLVAGSAGPVHRLWTGAIHVVDRRDQSSRLVRAACADRPSRRPRSPGGKWIFRRATTSSQALAPKDGECRDRAARIHGVAPRLKNFGACRFEVRASPDAYHASVRNRSNGLGSSRAQLPTAVFIAQILIGSDQDFENCLEGVSAPEPCCVDGCSYISLGLGGPHCAVAVGDFPLDHAGPQFSL